MKNVFALSLCLLTIFSFGQKTKMPIMESLFGPTSTNACAGNTRLTVGISKYGELVNLKWPCSNYYDHLNYKTLYPVPWGRRVDDYDRYLNADKNQGSYASLQYEINGKTTVSPLRSEEWETSQTYLNDNAPIVVTAHESKELGIRIVQTDLVVNDSDILIRHYQVDKISEKGLSKIKLLYLANMAPCNYKPDFNPGGDWANDADNGFANMYDLKNDYFISFNPNKAARDKKKLPATDTIASVVDKFIQEVDALFPAAPSTNNIDITDIYCIIGASRKNFLKALYEDKTQKGKIVDFTKSNNKLFALSPALVINSYEVNFDATNKDEIDIFFAFGSSLQKASSNFNEAKKSGYKNSLDVSNTYWNKKINAAHVPKITDERMTKTLKRTLINILLSTNGDSGGIGSSVSAIQPPYVMIWPRDAAMMSFVLDLAGYHEEAEKNNLFFTKVQRKKNFEICKDPLKFQCYQGTWFQCYYADGRPSWMYDFEIDEVGWGIWMFYIHSQFLKDDASKEYLQKVFPSIVLAADFLTDFKDPISKLQKRAREDDTMWQDQSIYGAASVLLGLKAAASAAKLLNEKEKKLKWQNRVEELERAVEKWLWNKSGKEYQKAIYGNFGGRGIIIWPALIAKADSSRVQQHADGLIRQIDPFFKKLDEAKNTEWWYIGKATTAISFAAQKDSIKLSQAKKYLEILLKEASTKDTYVFGETPMVRDMTENVNGKSEVKRAYDNRVGQHCRCMDLYDG
jgi:hypothetical protein